MTLRLPDPSAAGSDARTCVEGTIDRITFEDDTTGFRVVRLAVATASSPVVVVGRFQRVAPGCEVRVTGRFESDPRHGRQFRAESVLPIDPSTRAGIAKYLGSGLIPGIGPVLAARVVDHFGDETLAVLDANPGRLAEVAGFGSQRVRAVTRAYADQRATRDTMVFLQGHGVSVSTALRIVRRFGADTVRVISENPYRLASEVWGIGFRRADDIAKSLGLQHDAPARLRAVVLHVLELAAERGHVFLPRPVLVIDAERIGGVDGALIEQAVDLACGCGEVVSEEFDEAGKVVYVSRRRQEEVELAGRIAALARARTRPLQGAEEAIGAFERAVGATLAPAQRDAVHQAAQRSLLVVTGGPGVGKTTIVRALIELYLRAHLEVRLAAPTGRASRRLAEATAREAATLHRLLEFDPRTGTFARSERAPLELDVLIVDESSMVDQSLACSLLRAVPRHARVVLVGDVDQLPSIGPGAVLHDIITSDAVAVVRLTEVFRQASESGIVRNAHRIRHGVAPESAAAGPLLGDFYVVRAADPDEAADRVLRLVCERIPHQFGMDPLRDIQVLTPMHKGAAGSASLNERLQHAINPNGRLCTLGARSFRGGDKVMQLRNDYSRDVYNGDIGLVLGLGPKGDQLLVSVDGRTVAYDASQLDELTLAYACSIHKSQGSEYPAVVVPMLRSHYVLLSRNLLYTAVTRGKRLVVLVSDERALRVALSETRREERYTWLFHRIRDAARAS